MSAMSKIAKDVLEIADTIGAAAYNIDPWSTDPNINASLLRAAAARLDELERENARMRAALEEIARVDVGGLQGIAEDHRFDADDHDKKEALAKLQAWHDEENVYLMGRIADRRSRARAALAGSEKP